MAPPPPLALDVRFRWGDQQLAAGLFDAPQTITVGPGKGATFQLDAAFIPGEHVPLLRQQDGAWLLNRVIASNSLHFGHDGLQEAVVPRGHHPPCLRADFGTGRRPEQWNRRRPHV